MGYDLNAIKAKGTASYEERTRIDDQQNNDHGNDLDEQDENCPGPQTSS
jgi:hypothetical protein